MSLISKSVLHQLPEDIYSVGNSVKLQVLTFASVRLRFNGFLLKLLAIDADLNHGSAYSFLTPEKWRACTGNSIFSHSGQISTLLGSDIPLAFPKKRNMMTEGQCCGEVFSPIKPSSTEPSTLPESITWTDPEPRFNINTVCIQSVSMQNIQEQLLLTISAENFSDPTNHDKLNLLSKERGIQEIMENTLVDKDNNKVLVNYLYKENLENLGENYFGATRRTQVLYTKVYPQPRVASEMDKYIKEPVNNSNYIEINIHAARQEGHQLHFVGYNFVVSSTSSSTKVRMMTNSSMRTETGISLKEVTKPAPGIVPSLRGILIQSRCTNYFAFYYIQKFFRSVRTSVKDSYLRIVCVPFPSFSADLCSLPTWRYYRDQAIPFGNSASGD